MSIFLQIDSAIFHAINGLGSEILDPVFIGVSFIGSPLVVALLTLFWALLIVKRKDSSLWQPFGFWVGALLLTVMLSTLAKDLTLRARPGTFLLDARMVSQLPDDSSFPSGHVAVATAALILLGNAFPRYRFALLAFLLLMIFSRIYVGAHWPSDALGGMGVGLFSVIFVQFFGKLRLGRTSA